MKRYFLIFLIVLPTIFLYAENQSLPNPYEKNYPFESAIIHYENKTFYGHGKPLEGTTVAYIKGDKTALVTKMTVLDGSGKPREIETLQIIDPEHIYLINMTQNVGTKLDNPISGPKAAYDALSASEKEVFHERLAKSRIVSMHLPPLGIRERSEEIIGLECDLYHLSSGFAEATVDSEYWDEQTCVWGNTSIVLHRREEHHEIITTQTATKIKKNVPIQDSKFVVPKEPKITYDELTSEYRNKTAMSAFNGLRTGASEPFAIKLKGERMKAKEVETEKEKNKKKSQTETMTE